MIYLMLVLSILVNSYNYSKPVSWGTIVNENMDLINGWFTVEDCDETMYATEKVNIRVSPKVGTTKIGYLKKNEAVQVTGICDNGWSRVSYNEAPAYINSSYLSPNKAYGDIFVEVIGVSDEYVNEVLSNYYLAPEAVRNNFEEFGGVLSITNENLGAKFFGDLDMNIVAVTNYKGSTGECSINIGIKDAKAVLHELGHFLDYYTGYTSDTDSYKATWGSELEAFKSFHFTAEANINTPHEYFAESFQVYVESPDELKEKCPQSYDYIGGIINGITEYKKG